MTALLSLPIALYVFMCVFPAVGASLYAEAFAAGLEPIAWLSILLKHEAGLPAAGALAAGLVGLWAIVSTYLNGATIAALSRSERISTNELYSSGGRVFGRLLRLLPLATTFWGLLVGGSAYGLYRS